MFLQNQLGGGTFAYFFSADISHILLKWQWERFLAMYFSMKLESIVTNLQKYYRPETDCARRYLFTFCGF